MEIEVIGTRNGNTLHCKVEHIYPEESFKFTKKKGMYFAQTPDGIARIYQEVDGEKWYTRPEFNNRIFPHVMDCYMAHEGKLYLGYVTIELGKVLAKQAGLEIQAKMVDGGMLYTVS